MSAIVCAAFPGLPKSARASAFNQPAGEGQVIVTSVFSQAEQGYDVKGRVTGASRFRKFEATALIEYGVTEWLTALIKPGYDSMRSQGVAPASYTGPGTSEVGAQVRVLQFDKTAIALQGSIRIPGSTDRVNPLLMGNTRPDFDIRALFGRTFQIGSWWSFGDLQVGYRQRGNPAPNEFHVDVTLGIRPREQLLFLLQAFNTLSLPQKTPGFPSNSAYKMQISAVYDFTKSWSGQIGVFQVFAGRNTIRERGVLAAAWYRF